MVRKSGMITMRVDNMDAAPVKGAPSCATVTTEHTQLLADGNRIHTTDRSALCRDSEGRTLPPLHSSGKGAGVIAGGPKRALVGRFREETVTPW